jgi:trans-aconitate methyltransferase
MTSIAAGVHSLVRLLPERVPLTAKCSRADSLLQFSSALVRPPLLLSAQGQNRFDRLPPPTLSGERRSRTSLLDVCSTPGAATGRYHCNMSALQTWDPANYARHARFVSDLGSPVLELLAPSPGDRILDLGCGDGALTKKLVDLGCEVVAVDSSAPQIEAARKLGLDAHEMNAEALPFGEEFDAVFSNAVLHWIKNADPMIASVYRAIRPGGRFVAECGGYGCVQKVRTALVQALNRRGIEGEARVPWYFPTPGDYATRLERAGFRVDSIALIPRPTPLPGDIIGWLETFAQSFLEGLPGPAREEYLQEVRAALEPQLRENNGTWVADYIRLRFAATKAPLLK